MLLVLTSLAPMRGQEFAFGPGALDRIQVIVESFRSGATIKATNTLAPGAAFTIADSGFPQTGQSLKVQFDGQPPVQPLLDGTLRFNFPAVTPARDFRGVFQPSMPASVTFQGAWTKGHFNYSRGEAVSYSAAQLLLGGIQPTSCPNAATSRARTGAPIPVGANPVSVSAACDLTSLTSLGGNNPVEAEHAASGVLQIIAGDGGVGDNPIFSSVSANVSYLAIYKSRRRPEIGVNTTTLNFAHTDGQPLPAGRTLILTNTGGLTLNWAAKVTNTFPTSVGTPGWLKLSSTHGSLEGQASQPIEFSVNTTGLAAGSYTARVTVEGNTWNGPKVFLVALNFTGVPRLSVTPGALEFFNTVSFPQQSLTLKNEGSLRLAAELVVTSDPGWLDAPRSIGSIEPGQSSTITVRALPFPPPNFIQIAPGDYNGQILVKPAANQPPQQDFPSVTVPAVFHVQLPGDQLAILAGSVAPATNEPIKLDTTYTNFKADVTYQLGTRDNADLALRLFDESGNLQGSSEFIRVARSEGRVAARRLTISAVTISPGALGITPSRLILRAVLLDRSLLTTVKSTPETEYVYTVEPAIKLALGTGTSAADFRPESPGELHAGPWNLLSAHWPAAATVDVPKGSGIRGVNVTARFFRAPGLSRFYTTTTKPLAANFGGRVFFNLADTGFHGLPDEAAKYRADVVQFRANVVNLESTTIEESQQIDLPVERINLVASEPPFGSILPRSEPNRIRLTAEYNVPNFGRRLIQQRVDSEEPCIRPGRNDLKDEELGPGRAQFTYEVTAYFPLLSKKTTAFHAGILLTELNRDIYALDCDRTHAFALSDEVFLPTTPSQSVTAADATLTIIANPTATPVDVSSPRRSLAAVAAGQTLAAVGVGMQQARSARAASGPRPASALNPADIISLNQVWHFDPPIPAGRGFSADLSLTWAPDVVPDDPNFMEADVQILSIDPATGALQRHPTTVDLATRTATARIQSLDGTYTLGVIGPFPRRVLHLPLLSGPNGFATRLNIVAGAQATGLSLTALDAAGQVIDGDGNPLVGFVAPHALASPPIPAGFGLSFTSSDAWMQGVVAMDACALLRIQRSDAGDIAPSLRAFPRLVLPGLEQSATRSTELRLANPTRFDTPISLELRRDDGTSAGTFQGLLGARTTLAGTLSNIFPGLASGFSGSVVAKGDTDLVGMALVRSGAALAIIEGQPVGHEPYSLLVAPGVTTGGPRHRGRLSIANAGNQSHSIRVRFIGDNGTNVAPPVEVSLSPGQQYQADVGTAFGLNTATAIEGTLVVEGALVGLAGELTTFDAGGKDLFRASQPLSGTPAVRHAYAHFDNSAAHFTTVSLHNASDVPATVSVSVRRPDGTELGSAALALAGKARATRRLAAWVPASAGIAGGSFVVDASGPIWTSALAGEDSLNSLEAIPAHARQAVATPEPPPGPFAITARLDGNQLVLSWPEAALGFTLESAEGLAPPVGWIGITTVASVNAGVKSVPLSTTNTSRYFRLYRKP